MHRTSIHKNARRSSGGVAVYIKSDISRGVLLICKGPSEHLWIKLDKNYFGLTHDIIVCLCYIIPENSTAQCNTDVDVIDRITLDIAEFQVEYLDSLFVVCGDTNGRTATLNDYLEYDNCDHLPLPDFYTEDSNVGNRCNMDRVINSQVRRIIDLCKMCNLKILNGRFGADANIGKYTCHVYNGSSTVDYFMSSPAFFDIVYDLQVKAINEFSDHCAVELQLRLSNNPRQTTVRVAEKMTWDAEKIDNYPQNISSEMAINKFNHMLSILE